MDPDNLSLKKKSLVMAPQGVPTVVCTPSSQGSSGYDFILVMLTMTPKRLQIHGKSNVRQANLI